MRILMVTNLFYPLLGGSEQVVFEYSRRLVRRGHEIHVLTEQSRPQWPSRERVEGIHIHRYPVRYGQSLTRFVTGVFNAFRWFRHIIAENRFDILHFHLPLPSVGVLLCRRSRYTGRIASFYGPWDEEELVEKQVSDGWHPHRLKAFFFRRLQRFVLRNSQKIVVLSQYSQGQLGRFITPVNALLLPGGVDLNRFCPAGDRVAIKTRLQIPSDHTVLLTVRRLVTRMGVDRLIESMPTILEKKPDTILIIGSDGPLREELEHRTKTLGLERHIRFTGFISPEELPLYYQAADLFIMPTRSLEGFGLPIIEAMSCGTPAVGTTIGSITEIIGRFDPGLLIPDASTEAIAATVLSGLAPEFQNDAFRSTCRAYVETHYNWERIVDDLENLYSAVAAGGA